jgi:hypothetical protein
MNNPDHFDPPSVNSSKPRLPTEVPLAPLPLPPLQTRTRPNWSAGFFGFIAGGVLVIGILCFSTLGALQPQKTPVPGVVSPPMVWPTPTPTPAQPPAGFQATPDLIHTAQSMLDSGQSQAAVDLLTVQAEGLPNNNLKFAAYRLLAQGQFSLHNFNLAAAYYEKAHTIQPDPMLLWDSANAFDQGGNLNCALDRYQALIRLNNTSLDAVRPTAVARAEALKTIFPTPRPCK